MGYTTHNTGLLLGLGVSSISDAGYAYSQNQKTLHDYYAAVNSGKLAVFRGYELSSEDISFRNYILDISCRGKTLFQENDNKLLKQYVFPQLKKLEEDSLISWNNNGLELLPAGRSFIRNVCAAFDIKLHMQIDSTLLFSRAI